MIGVHQTNIGGDDPIPVAVWIVAKSNIKFILELDQTRHGIR